MTPIKINGTPCEMPGDWEELKTRQFLTLAGATKFSHVLSVLAQVDLPEITESHDLQMDEKIYPFLEWYIHPPEWATLKPTKVIKFKNEYITVATAAVPNEIAFSTYGQVEVFKQLFAEISQAANPEEGLKNLIVPAVAIWIQPIYDKDVFDETRAKLYEEDVLNMSIMQVYPLATALIRRHLGIEAFNQLHPQGFKHKVAKVLRKQMVKLWKNLDIIEQKRIIY